MTGLILFNEPKKDKGEIWSACQPQENFKKEVRGGIWWRLGWVKHRQFLRVRISKTKGWKSIKEKREKINEQDRPQVEKSQEEQEKEQTFLWIIQQKDDIDGQRPKKRQIKKIRRIRWFWWRISLRLVSSRWRRKRLQQWQTRIGRRWLGFGINVWWISLWVFSYREKGTNF